MTDRQIAAPMPQNRILVNELIRLSSLHCVESMVSPLVSLLSGADVIWYAVWAQPARTAARLITTINIPGLTLFPFSDHVAKRTHAIAISVFRYLVNDQASQTVHPRAANLLSARTLSRIECLLIGRSAGRCLHDIELRMRNACREREGSCKGDQCAHGIKSRSWCSRDQPWSPAGDCRLGDESAH